MELTNMTIEDVYRQLENVCSGMCGITYVNGNYLALCSYKKLNDNKCGFCDGIGICNAAQYKEINRLLGIADKYMVAEISDTSKLLMLLDKYPTVVELLQSGATTRRVCDEILDLAGKYSKIKRME